MGYKATISGNVDKAFKMLKDLAVMVTLSSKKDSGFDFATNAPVTVVTTSKNIPAIPLQKRRSRSTNPDNTMSHSFIFKAKDLPDPTIYDTISVIGGETWKVIPPYDNDGYIVTANVAREV
jgi:hypothetical protein